MNPAYSMFSHSSEFQKCVKALDIAGNQKDISRLTNLVFLDATISAQSYDDSAIALYQLIVSGYTLSDLEKLYSGGLTLENT